MIDLAESLAVLSRTPSTLHALLAGVPESWTAFRATDESWSPYDVVGHLAHGERTDWIPRLRTILEHGTAQAFTPFDREGMKSDVETLDQLVGTFAGLRAQSLQALAASNLSAADLHRRGLHPDLGEVTLGQLIASWVVHDLSHVAQVAETMAKRYRDDIGPWRAYLPVVDRAELPD